MRLLNASTVELHEFAETEVPRYAILSHRWGEQEVSMQELTTLGAGRTHNSRGYTKIKRACALAKHYELQYIWIDTCCIDKTSSAELSEAINSMYHWYAQSVLCFAHLADIELRPLVPAHHEDSVDSECCAGSKSFVDSEWFRRGWTLQELLAPVNLLFFDANWQEIGMRSALAPHITEATKIAPDFLRQERDIHEASIAQRMSWASLRKTTRVEDIAYCLMGLFDVNMPLLYGEGKKAFLRLQQELIRNYNDESIYAWEISRDRESGELTGMLATEPTCFANSGRIVSIELPGMRQMPFSITNRGIAMKLPSMLERDKKKADYRSIVPILSVSDRILGVNKRMLGVNKRFRDADGYEIPMACANAEDVHKPMRLCIVEAANGSYVREHPMGGLTYFPDCSAQGLDTRTFHVALSPSHQYSLSRWRDNAVLKIPEWVTVLLRPAAQAVLRPLGTNWGDEKLYFVRAGPRLWQYRMWGKDNKVDFQYKERQSIRLVYKDNKIGLHIHDICQMNGCKEYWNTRMTTSKSLANTSTTSSTSSPGENACEQDQNSADREGLPVSIGDPLWDECTYIDWGECQSRPVDDGNFLWLSTRILDGRGMREWILDFDISPLDRREVFLRRD